MLGRMRGVFVVGDHDPSGERWGLALDLLKRGQPFALGPVTFRRTDAATIEADVVGSWPSRPVTDAGARKDLEEARSWVEELVASDAAFRDAIGSSAVDYVLVDDYDIGYIRLCRLTDKGDLEWFVSQP